VIDTQSDFSAMIDVLCDLVGIEKPRLAAPARGQVYVKKIVVPSEGACTIPTKFRAISRGTVPITTYRERCK